MMMVLLERRKLRSSSSLIRIRSRRDGMVGPLSVGVLDAHVLAHALGLAGQHPALREEVRREAVVRGHLDAPACELRHAAGAVALLAGEGRVESGAARRL